MAKRFLKPTIDWAKLDKVVPPDDHPKYLVFKAKSEDFLRRMESPLKSRDAAACIGTYAVTCKYARVVTKWEIKQFVQVNPPEPPPIDWEGYRKTVPVKGLVDQFKQKYEACKVPYPKDNMTVKVDEQWKSLEPGIKKFCEEQQKQIDECKKEIERIKGLLPFEEMTMEDVFVMYPEEALDPINKPTFWPHNPEEQYVPENAKSSPPSKAAAAKK